MKTKKTDKFSILITEIYATLLIVFGFIGFYNGRSLISLLSGGVSGLILFGCSFGMKKNRKNYTLGAILCTTLLMASFFFRALASHKTLPIVFASLSLCIFLTLFYRLIRK